MPNSSAPKNPDRSHDDDSWEQLESELFGIPYGKEHAPAPSNDSTESRDDEFDVAPVEPTPAAEIPPEPAPAMSVAADPEAPSDEFGYDEPAPAAAEAKTPPPAQPSAGEAGSDSYWNALENFDWTQPSDSRPRGREEGGRDQRGRPPQGGSRGRDQSRGPRRDSARRDSGGRPSERPRGPAPASSSSAPASSSYRPAPHTPPPKAHDGFGQGLDEEVRTPPVSKPIANDQRGNDDFGFTPDEPITVAAETTSPPTGSPPTERGAAPAADDQRRKRRRRGRRGRGSEGRETSASAGSNPPGSSVPLEPQSSTDGAWDSAADEPEDDFAAAEETTAAPASAADEQPGERRPPRGRRNGRRDNGPRRESIASANPEQSEEHPDDQLIVDSAGATHEIDDSVDDEGDSEELDVSYGHVPSWEEAISYLLNPSLVESVSSAPDSAQSSDHGRPPPRHRGHKRH